MLRSAAIAPLATALPVVTLCDEGDGGGGGGGGGAIEGEARSAPVRLLA